MGSASNVRILSCLQIMKVHLVYSSCLWVEKKRNAQLLRGGELGLHPHVSLTWAVSLSNHRTESLSKEMEIEKLWAIIHSCNYSEEVYCICMFPQ